MIYVILDVKPIKQMLANEVDQIIPILSDEYNEIGSLETLKSGISE